MQRELKGLQQTTMTLWSKWLAFSVTLLLCTSTTNFHAQVTSGNVRNSCLIIHVRLNGKAVRGPQLITFKTKKHEEPVSVGEGGCFRVPSALQREKNIDVFFTLPKNKVYLSSIPIGFFAGSWDIELADKRFGKDVVLPKHVRTKDACAVVFHVGEPETAYTMAPCRTPL